MIALAIIDSIYLPCNDYTHVFERFIIKPSSHRQCLSLTPPAGNYKGKTRKQFFCFLKVMQQVNYNKNVQFRREMEN